MTCLSSLSDAEVLSLANDCANELRHRAENLNASAALSGQFLSSAEMVTVATRALEYQKRQIHLAAMAEAERSSLEKIRTAEAEQQARLVAETERLRWARRKGIALAAQWVFAPDPKLQITIWVGPDGEKRVYVDHGFGGVKLATYYATGNRKNPPGTFETNTRHEERLAFCKALAAAYGAMKLNLETAASWDGEPVQIPGYEPPKECQ